MEKERLSGILEEEMSKEREELEREKEWVNKEWGDLKKEREKIIQEWEKIEKEKGRMRKEQEKFEKERRRWGRELGEWAGEKGEGRKRKRGEDGMEVDDEEENDVLLERFVFGFFFLFSLVLH